ncbi:MAG TPA: type III-B CRISPR module RAMP protein Cmr4 [Candidatus Marinimicrobia bacterium]|nr:type III-B CRISPR module RAMP protein Cmr4 [Candidatus Neomarinimicrobiota bacterium]
MSNAVKSYLLVAQSTDPIYIGTGGYTIGRVDNTIVRDPITRIPKIPGTSMAGTWRYYMTLDQMTNGSGENKPRIQCAGQDEYSHGELGGDKGHCGKCIVCNSFGYSKTSSSKQGLVSFTDLNILFFPVYTRLGTRWITSEQVLKGAGLIDEKIEELKKEIVAVSENESGDKYINLGWMNLETKKREIHIDLGKVEHLTESDIIIVPEKLIAQIINANLEVRTSVSIDPNTGAAKEGALFTSEAIPRATYFYGNVHIFDRPGSGSIQDTIKDALCNSKQYYETLGIGGMTTRGFGRMNVEMFDDKLSENACREGGV